MAFVFSRENISCFGLFCGAKIALFTTSTDDSPSTIQAPCYLHLDNFSSKYVDTAELGQQKTNKSAQVDQNKVISASISDCGTFIVAVDNIKLLYLWKKNNEQWEPLSCRSLVRKCLKVIFSRSASEVLVADRGGDVFTFPVNVPSEKGKLLLGHLNIILDIAITKGDKYLITCDRDGKIRVSMYPNTYTIQSYCLEHTEFVSALQISYDPKEFLLSGSGDGSLRMWNFQEGKQICCYKIDDCKRPTSLTSDISEDMDQDEESAMNSKTECHSKEGKVLSHSLAVRTIRHCPVNNAIAVMFHLHTDIHIYMVSRNCDKKIQSVQILPFENVPLDAYFDAKGYLWVFVSSKTESLLLYRCEMDTKIHFSRVENDASPLWHFVSEINENLQPFGSSGNFEQELMNLYKHCYDNDVLEEDSNSKNKPRYKKNKVV